MSKRRIPEFLAAVCLLSLPGRPAAALSPYGLASIQTIPFVLERDDERGIVWQTEVNVHNPGPVTLEIEPTYFGAIGTPTPGRVTCNRVFLPSRGTAQFTVRSLCPLGVGFNVGRLELAHTKTVPPPSMGSFSEDPADQVFLANARLLRAGKILAVEGFPEGRLSGNRSFAAVTGLKSGTLNGEQWRTLCYAATLDEAVPVFIRLVDATGQPLGGFAGAALDPALGKEMQIFSDVFNDAGVPPGNFENVTALFSTSILPNGGQGGPAVVGFCRIVNVTQDQEAFHIAKYLDNHDLARQYRTSTDRTSFGAKLYVGTEIDPDTQRGTTNLHGAYFQHPDRIACEIRFGSANKLATFDMVQVRLIDPNGSVVAGGPQAQRFTFDIGAAAARSALADGGNGKWFVEVAPDRGYNGCKNCLHQGGLDATPYSLTCSSGQGHNDLDIVGHCGMRCTPVPNRAPEVLCAFDTPFDPANCGY
jgi:hypothetical protein